MNCIICRHVKEGQTVHELIRRNVLGRQTVHDIYFNENHPVVLYQLITINQS
jgi:hypothetical protein